MIMLGLVAALVGAWFDGTRLTPVWGPAAGAVSDVTTTGPFGVRVGQALYLGGPPNGEPVVVVKIIDATHFEVARSCRIGWRIVHRRVWRF